MRTEASTYFRPTYQHESHLTGAYLFTRPVPGIGAERGDCLLYAYHPELRPAEVYGRQIHLDYEDSRSLRETLEAFDDLRLAIPRFFYNLVGEQGEEMCRVGPEQRWADPEPYDPSARFAVGIYHFLRDRHRWGKRLRPYYSRLILVKAWEHTVSDPIVAGSDEAAIFSLVHDVGCTLRKS